MSKQMSDSVLIGILLAVVGGFLDSYTYFSRGGVFANAQTGNMVLLAVKLAEGSYMGMIYYLIPIIAFAVGVFFVENIRKKYKNNSLLHWRQIIIIAEIITLFAVGFVPAQKNNILVNTIISFTCSMQVEAFRKITGLAFATTMCTGNLRSGAEMWYKFKDTNDIQYRTKALKYFMIIGIFILGAVLGAFATKILAEKAVFICCIILIAVFLIMFKGSEV